MKPILIVPILVLAAACDVLAPQEQANTTAPPPAVPQASQPSFAFDRASIDQAAYVPAATVEDNRTPTVIRAQVLLDRARFSPGVIDGKPGENVRQAVAAFEQANSLPVDGLMDEAVFEKLTALDPRPVLKEYVITEQDVAGPFVASIPQNDLEALSKLKALSFTSPAEVLGEKFHMTEDLLKTLNPNVDLSKAGGTILVADLGNDTLTGQVATIEVDKAEKAVKAFDAAGKLLAFYPATIGSDELASPDGTLKVLGVSKNPTYSWDPSKMRKEGPKQKLTIAAGPNNPVGAVWIDLSKDTYGIHGTPDPQLIGKRASQGCVRLTNWDALELAAAVKPGVVVKFVGGGQTEAVESTRL